MSIETMTKLGSITVGAGNSATFFSFSNIPQGYTDLVIKLSGRTAAGGTADAVGLYFNTLQSNRVRITLAGNGTTASSDTSTYRDVGPFNASTSTSNTFNNSSIYIANYSSNLFKSFSAETIRENNSSDAAIALISGLWSDTSPITSITIDSASGGAAFAQHSTFTLYGIKNAAKTVGNSIKAIGGNISFDGTYVYHSFNTSGTFTPTSNLTTEILVVAGGGGGGGGNGGGGGGGAGGYRTLSSYSLNANSLYSITIGAGGNGGASRAYGTKGSDTIAFGITSSGGGQGGYYDGFAGTSGGSGGGGGSKGSGTTSGGAGNAGSYSPVEGYAGGSGTESSGYAGGGGGGAAAVGGNATTTTSGVGGAGNNWLSIGNYYAGGGGGGSNSTGTPSSGGIGGGGNGSNQVTAAGGTPGRANTGGGGGGGGDNGAGNAGGSGVVIIRYKG